MKIVQVWLFQMSDGAVVELEMIQTRDVPAPLYEMRVMPATSAKGPYDALRGREPRTYESIGTGYAEATADIAALGSISSVSEAPQSRFEPAACAGMLMDLRETISLWKREVGLRSGLCAAGVNPSAPWQELHEQLVSTDLILGREKRVPAAMRQQGQMLRRAIERFGTVMVYERRRQCLCPGQPPRTSEYKWSVRYIQAVLDEVNTAFETDARDITRPVAKVICLDDMRRRKTA